MGTNAGMVGPLDMDEFLRRAEEFHGHVSPGVVLGGCMAQAAWEALGDTPYLNAVVETVVCLPDAVMLLTGCTLGNGFLKVLDWGKFALTLYDRVSLEGRRAWVDPAAVAGHPLVDGWFIRRPGAPQVDKERVVAQLLEVGPGLVRVTPVRLNASLKDEEKVPTMACPGCGETFPTRFGGLCPACQGQAYYSL